jgi:cytidylate kinase
MDLLGIAGSNGSGKDTLGEILADKYGYLFVSVTDILRDALKVQDLPLSRKNMRELSADWRRQYGLGVLVDRALTIYEQDGQEYKGLALASIRNPGEADRIHELGGRVVWLDAPAKIRYERIQANRTMRGAERSVDDEKTFEQFLDDEKAEMHSSGDQATLSLSAVKEKSDIFIENDSNEVETFLNSVEIGLGL